MLAVVRRHRSSADVPIPLRLGHPRQHMGRFNSALGLFGLGALLVCLGRVSGTSIQPLVDTTAGTTATTALDSPIAKSVTPYVPDGAMLFFGGATAIGIIPRTDENPSTGPPIQLPVPSTTCGAESGSRQRTLRGPRKQANRRQ
ncbi:uncharacterized protein PAN0_014d4821 [Moesziomyces antarcticus]|uniref:Uncharacterized protein n=1 Tax=Pseudozyma antarctica TaxID=84753 RepID=A0A081CIV2_PSEA2|nr:uncharacterized protein PAN0_014d4821 [Moesziomyces antarcticus]GAK66598.1 hypothetical protein PAN0_014d4821 [Moesziomyces antarcticus]